MVALSTFPGCTEKISNKQGLMLREVTGSYKAKTQEWKILGDGSSLSLGSSKSRCSEYKSSTASPQITLFHYNVDELP